MNAPALASAGAPNESSSAAAAEPVPAPVPDEPAPALEEPEPASDPGAVALPAFEIEAPYLPGQPARPTGRMAASIFDEQLARWNMGGSSDSSHPSNRPNYHPAARVVVDLVAPRALAERSTRGPFASSASLLAEARNQGYWPFRTCYEEGLRAKADLNGQVRMRLRISTSGRVLSARLASVELANRPAVDCIVRSASSLTFRKPPARRVDVQLSVKLWPGDARLPPRNEATRGTWNPSSVQNVLSANSADIARCCAEALGRDPKLWGRIAFAMQADALGQLQSVQESESRFPDRAASDCMRLALLQAAPLPTPSVLEFSFAVRCGHPPASAPESAPASTSESAPSAPNAN